MPLHGLASRYNTYKGDLIDGYVKSALQKAGDDELYNLYITARFEQGPDVTRLSGLPDNVEWWDITTRAEWADHLRSYAPVWGPNSTGIFWDEIEMAMGAEGSDDGGAAGGDG